MKKQKIANNDYMKIVEINENMNLFKEFLNEEHSDVECKDFCLKMIDKCPELKNQIHFVNDENFNLSTVRMMSALYDRYVEHIYSCSGIEKILKPKKNLIKETDSLIKRKTFEIKGVFVKSLIFVVSMVLFVCSFYVKDVECNSVILAIATGLFSSLIFEYLVRIQKEFKENKKRQINLIISQCKMLKKDFVETKENYLNNDNDEMNFYDFIMSYKRLYEYIQELKSKVSFNTFALKIDSKAFECYYQNQIHEEIKTIYDNYKNLKNIYLDKKEDYKEIILKPYALAIELIDNIIGLYVVDFGFIKQKEEMENGSKEKRIIQ